MNQVTSNAADQWNQSRQGAWASGGFHYQHLIAVYLLLRQWCSIDPSGTLTPEGLDDITIERDGLRLWIQVKSRNRGHFTKGEIQKFFHTSQTHAQNVSPLSQSTIIIGERKAKDYASYRLADTSLVDQSGLFFSCEDPIKHSVALLKGRLKILEGTAFSVIAYLHFWVSKIARQNGQVKYEHRVAISPSDLVAKIMEATDSGAVDMLEKVLTDGIMRPVNFSESVDTGGFYSGVAVQPGHIGAGLVFDRPDDLDHTHQIVQTSRQLVISAPSGAGKSALMWLTAKRTNETITWFSISKLARLKDLNDILRFIRTFQPNNKNPIGVAVDDISATNCELWNILSDELRAMEGSYLIGSTRTENMQLIEYQPKSILYTPALTEKLAQSLWNALSSRNLAKQDHWLESYESSGSLLLEYMHMLTQGENLQETINGQVRTRQNEERFNELKILRVVTLTSSLHGLTDTKSLIHALGISSDIATVALQRLLNEHLVAEYQPGIIGGLHDLRSKALLNACHDDILHSLHYTLELALKVTTEDSLPLVIHALLSDERFETDDIYDLICTFLTESKSIAVWIAVFTGLRDATLDHYTAALGHSLSQRNFPKSLWSFAAGFVDPSINISNMGELGFFKDLNEVIADFRSTPKQDYRGDFLQYIKTKAVAPPSFQNPIEYTKLLSACAPILGGHAVLPDSIATTFSDADVELHAAMELLETAYFVNPDMARDLAVAIGGEESLLARFKEATPYISSPTVNENGEHGRTIETKWHSISEHHQEDAHESIVEVCKGLLALAPSVNAISCVAAFGDGQTIPGHEGYAFVEKNITREGLPSEIRVTLNQRFKHHFDRRYGLSSKTEYATLTTPLIIETESIFREFTEKWLQQKSIALADRVADTLNSISDRAQKIAMPYVGDFLDNNSPPTDHSIDVASVLINLLKNIVPRLSNIANEISGRALPTYIKEQAQQVDKIAEHPIWNYITAPPCDELRALHSRLHDLSDVVHGMVGDELSSLKKIQSIVSYVKKAPRNKAVTRGAQKSRYDANQELKASQRKLTKAFADQGWKISCSLKDIDEISSPFWPRAELCIILHINDLVSYNAFSDEAIALIREHSGMQNSVTLVPALNNKAIAIFALSISESSLYPVTDFATKWENHLGIELAKTPLAENYLRARQRLLSLSGLIAYCGLADMHEDEHTLFKTLERDFEDALQELCTAFETCNEDVLADAISDLDERAREIQAEHEACKAGHTYIPICSHSIQELNGEYIDETAALLNILLIEADLNNETVE